MFQIRINCNILVSFEPLGSYFSSLYPFKVEYFIDIKDAEYYEKQIHKILDISRVNKNREFFKLPLDEIKSILKKLANSSHNYDTKMKMTEIKQAISND